MQLSELQSFFGDDCAAFVQTTSNQKEILADTNTAVINSIVLSEKLYLVLQLPNGTVQSYPITIDQLKLKSSIERWRSELENTASDEYLELSRFFYNLFIRPMADTLKKQQPSTLVFINDGILRNVPMAALHDGQQFLIEKYPISYSLGFGFKPLNPIQPNLRSLIFGLSVEVPPFSALPNVAIEAENVRNLIGGQKFLDRDFTEKSLQEQVRKDNYSLVHLATHGFFGGTAQSAFVQAFDRRISLIELEEILSRRTQALSLLTLSACETAAGNERSVLGLVGVAIRSGVNSTLGSLWAVQDKTAVELITDFYQYRQQGLNLAAALQKAQLNQIARRDLQHPSLWGALIPVTNSL